MEKYITKIYNAKTVCQLVDALWYAVLSDLDGDAMTIILRAYKARVQEFKPFYNKA